MRDVLALRIAVFVDEQRVPASEEIDAHDAPADDRAAHVLARADGAVVGTGRFYARDERTAQIGRMAVAESARRTGVGRALLDALMDEARARGYPRARLSAQIHALGFYEKAGFIIVGKPYDDCGIPHVDMERVL